MGVGGVASVFRRLNPPPHDHRTHHPQDGEPIALTVDGIRVLNQFISHMLSADFKHLRPSSLLPDRSPLAFARFGGWAREYLPDEALTASLRCLSAVPSPELESKAVIAAWAEAYPYREYEVLYIVSWKWWAQVSGRSQTLIFKPVQPEKAGLGTRWAPLLTLVLPHRTRYHPTRKP